MALLYHICPASGKKLPFFRGVNDEQARYLELALSEIRKIEDVHPEFIEKTHRVGAKLDGIGYALERCMPGRVQATLGKTKLKYFGPRRVGSLPAVDQRETKPFLDVFFRFRSIARSAVIIEHDVDDKGREYIECMLLRKSLDKFRPDETFREADIGWITLRLR